MKISQIPLTLPRHEQVVPSFVAETLKFSLTSWVGEVQPAEPLKWQRGDELSERARRDLRRIIVARTRPRAQRLWFRSTRVRIVEDWQARLAHRDRERVAVLFQGCDKAVELRTLREVKDRLREPLEAVLGLLARLDAIYWMPADVIPTRKDSKPPSDSQAQEAPSW